MGMTFEALKARIEAQGRKVELTARVRGEIYFSNETGRFTTPVVNLGDEEPTDQNIAEELSKLPVDEQRYKIPKSPKSGSFRASGADLTAIVFGPEYAPPVEAAPKPRGGRHGKRDQLSVPVPTAPDSNSNGSV